MSYEILVSTMNKDTNQVLCMLENANIKCNALVVVQGDIEDYQEINNDYQIIRIFFSKERGLSKSRNLALDNCNAEYGYIMDDDVLLKNCAIEQVVRAIETDSVDVVTCQFKHHDGTFPKKYSEHSFEHDMLSSAKVSSIEICVNIESIMLHKIRFDERFGLGTDWPSGEEYIFLTDCLKAGLKVKYYPIVTGIHPNETSGQDFYTSSSKAIAKREMMKRVFGRKSLFYIIAFWIKKLPLALKAGYGLQFSRAILFGTKK